MPQKRGFTLIELIVVAGIVAALAGLVAVSITRRRSESRLARVTVELNNIAKALTQYAEDNNFAYPADVGRGVPPGLEKYLEGGDWPVSSWPEGIYDYDSYTRSDAGPELGKQVYQISYRLCDNTDPIATCADPVIFPNFVRNSAIFYCISGPCVPHASTPTVPGYCVNCNPKEQNY